MTWKVLIAHEPGEESFAEELAEPIRLAGYEVSHRGTVEIGESVELAATVGLESGGPVVLCGTRLAVGSRWAWQLVNAARATEGRQRIFVVQMEREAYVEPLARDGAIAHYWQDPHAALQDLIASLRKHYPQEPASGQQSQAGLIDFTLERSRHGTIVGREEVFEKVRGWLDGGSNGWVLVKGGPGTGKSAILAAMLERLEKEFGVGSVPYHFLRRGQGNWNEPDAVVRNLNARLERIAAPAEHGTAQGLERLNALLVAVAAQNAREQRCLFVVVDGLDEAATARGQESVLGRFLPGSLPEGVFILCASRPNYPELSWLERRLGLHTIDLDQPPWSDDNRSVVKAYWHQHGPQLKPPLEPELLEAAVKAAEGNILHAVTLRDAFEADTQARDARRIPVGFEALLEDMWVRLVGMDDRVTSGNVIKGLGLLAVAGEALPLGTVARLLEWEHPAYIVDFKRYALPFLLEEPADWHDGEARYRPFHEFTREFLTTGDHMLPDTRRRNHNLLASRLAVWPPADDAPPFERQYAARYALTHLAATGDWERAGELLGDLRYVVAALEALGPQLLLARVAPFAAPDKPAQLAERANALRRVLRRESQFLESNARELPNLVHNRLTCMGWSREQIRSSFSGFDHGWGLVNPVDIGDEICILRGHTSSVKACDLDARGRYGVSGGWDGTVRIWDLDRGTNLRALRPDPEAGRCDITSCAISADGHRVVAASIVIRLEPRREYSRVDVWDAHDGRLLFKVEHDPLAEVAVAFADSDTVVACQTSGRVDIYDLGMNTSRQLTLGEEIGKAIAVDASGTMLAAPTADGCGVWGLDDGSKVSAVSFVSQHGAYACSFSPDGKSLAVGADKNALVASVADGSIRRSTTAIDQLSDCRLLDNRHLLFTSSWGCELVVWDMESDCAVARYEGHTYTADCCAVTGDGLYALSGGGDNTVRLWSLVEQVSSVPADRHAQLVYGCTVNAAATLACSAPQSEGPVIWDARTGTRLRPLSAYVDYGYVRFCSFEGHSRIATMGTPPLSLCDPETGERTWEAEVAVRDKYGAVSWVDEDVWEENGAGTDPGRTALLPLLYTGSHFVVWQADGVLRVVAIPEDARVRRLHAGRAVAVLNGDGLEIIDLDNDDSRRPIAEGVKECVGSPNDYAVYASMLNGQVCRLDAASGVQRVLGEVAQEHVRLLIDPQETALWALCYNGGGGLQASTDEALIAFSPDGSGVLQQASIQGHKVFGTCFLSGMLITAGWDATVRVWDARRPMPLAAISGSAPFRCVDAAADRVVAGDQKGNVWFLAPIRELYP